MEDPKQKANVIFIRGIAYGAMGKFKEAFADYRASTTPSSGFVMYSEWYIRSWEGLNREIAEHPNSKLYSQRADTYIKNGQYDLGIADLNKVIELELSKKEGSYPYGAYLSLGHLYVQLGKYDQALLEFNKALLYPYYRRNPAVNVNLAVIYITKGDLWKAFIHYRIAAQYYWTSLVR
jgi:tetratricopeptide (TPR) repeat protein